MYMYLYIHCIIVCGCMTSITFVGGWRILILCRIGDNNLRLFDINIVTITTVFLCCACLSDFVYFIICTHGVNICMLPDWLEMRLIFCK